TPGEKRMKRATYLGEVISNFDPMQPLAEDSFEWYVERPDSPHLELKSFLLNNRTDPKILFSGHRGSGKSTALNRLASDPEIRQHFFVVQPNGPGWYGVNPIVHELIGV